MAEASEPRKAVEPYKAKWRDVIFPLFWAGFMTNQLFQDAGGDWNRVAHALPFAIASCAAVIGALCLIHLTAKVLRPSFRRRPVAPGFDWPRWIVVVLSILSGVALFAHFSLSPPGQLTWNWTPVSWPPPDWKLYFAATGLFFGGIFLLSWWLGFVERDRARAAAKDRLNMGAGGRN